MQLGGVGPGLLRLVANPAPDLLADLFVPGRVLEADVVSVFADRAILAFRQGLRLEVTVQTLLSEGQRVRVQVQPPLPGGESASAGSPQPVVLKLVSLLARPEGEGAAVSGQTVKGSLQVSPTAVQIFWVPLPVPGGGQGWAQVQVQEEPDAQRRSPGDPAGPQVRIWWETPALGAVQVALSASGPDLSALFTAAATDTRSEIVQGLSGLQARLGGVGFPEARLGCRAPMPGEAIEPLRPEGAGRLDRRI